MRAEEGTFCVWGKHQECGPPPPRASRIAGLRMDFVHKRVVPERRLACPEGPQRGPQSKAGRGSLLRDDRLGDPVLGTDPMVT